MIRASRHALVLRNTATGSTARSVRFSSSSSLIPERNLWDTIYSGTKGLVSLLVSEESRQKFMEIVQASTINADVLKQARFGSMLTIALFHDLQDPLFEKYSFDPSDFLMGVRPSLSNFHDTLGRLQNEFPEIKSQEEQAEVLMERFRQIASTQMNAAPESPWTEQAQANHHSAAAKMSAMVSPRLFNSLFLTTETEAMMSKYKEGTTKVSYVALLSARAMVMDQEEFPGTNENSIKDVDEKTKAEATKDDNKEEEVVVKAETKAEDKSDDATKVKSYFEKSDASKEEADKKDEPLKASAEAGEEADKKDEPLKASSKAESEEIVASGETDATPVAAQIEVLYEMNHSVDLKPLIVPNAEGGEKSQLPPPGNTTKDETQIWVGTFEGWLNGGPDGSLRWRITHLRPPHAEFPGLYHSQFRST